MQLYYYIYLTFYKNLSVLASACFMFNFRFKTIIVRNLSNRKSFKHSEIFHELRSYLFRPPGKASLMKWGKLHYYGISYYHYSISYFIVSLITQITNIVVMNTSKIMKIYQFWDTLMKFQDII